MATSLRATVPSPPCCSSSSFKLKNLPKSSPYIKFNTSISTPTLSLNFLISPPLHSSIHKPNFRLHSTVQEEEEVAVEEQTQETVSSSDDKKKKLFVVNLPWSLSFTDIKTLFSECGTVKDVEIIKAKDGKHRGYAFVEMSSPDEAQAVLEKFDSYEVSGRIIRVEFAKRLKRPAPPPPAGAPVVETRHKLYVSNLAWKARATHLREFFSPEFSPVSARVIFDRPSGGSAGYGFVSFATKEEAEHAISSMDGKELMGRPVSLKFSEKNVDGSGNDQEENSTPEDQSKEEEDDTSKPEES